MATPASNTERKTTDSDDESIDRRMEIPGRRLSDREFSRSMGYNGDLSKRDPMSVLPGDTPDLMQWSHMLFDLVDITIRQMRRFNEVMIATWSDFLRASPVGDQRIDDEQQVPEQQHEQRQRQRTQR